MRGSLGEKIGEGAMADVHAGRLATRGRAEQVEMLDAELLQPGLMLPQLLYGLVAFHQLSRRVRSQPLHYNTSRH
jgi:hypothetical protein